MKPFPDWVILSIPVESTGQDVKGILYNETKKLLPCPKKKCLALDILYAEWH